MNICINFANSVIKFKYYPIRMDSTMMDATTVDLQDDMKEGVYRHRCDIITTRIVWAVNEKSVITPYIWSNVPLNSIWGPLHRLFVFLFVHNRIIRLNRILFVFHDENSKKFKKIGKEIDDGELTALPSWKGSSR